jgi:hypothetical protein
MNSNYEHTKIESPKLVLLFATFIFTLFYVRSSKGIKRLNQREKAAISIPDNVGEALIGIMLSDGHIQQRTLSSNPRFIFSQSGKMEKRPYFCLVYNLFKLYCVKDHKYYLRTWVDIKNKEEYSSISFTTMQLPCFRRMYVM